MTATRRIFLMVLLGACLVAALVFIPVNPAWLGAGAHHRLEGQLAPGFALPEISRPKSTLDQFPLNPVHTLAQHRGVVVVLNFWGTWCGPCVAEQEDFSAVARAYRGKGVLVLGIAVMEWRERVAAYASRHDVTYPLLLDGRGTVTHAYSVARIPQTFVIDRNGAVRNWFPGRVTKRRLTRAIDKALRVEHAGFTPAPADPAAATAAASR
jgi:peroxiredoxin